MTVCTVCIMLVMAGHDRHTHCRVALTESTEAGQLRLHGLANPLLVPDCTEQVVDDAAHAGGEEANDAIRRLLTIPAPRLLILGAAVSAARSGWPPAGK